MYMKRLIMAVMATSMFFPILAKGETNDNSGAETGTLDNWKGFSGVTPEDKHSGKNAFFITIKEAGTVPAVSTDLIPVNLEKPLKVSVWVKNTGKTACKIYAGVSAYDKDKKIIPPVAVNIVPETEAELIAACSPEDKEIKLKNAPAWEKTWGTHVAFDIDKTGKYGDIPNANISPRITDVIKNNDGSVTVILPAPVGRKWEAGTMVRMHQGGASGIFCAAFNVIPDNEWKEYAGTISGLYKPGEYFAKDGMSKWWAGTSYVALTLMCDFPAEGGKIMVDDFTLTIE